MQTSRHYLYHSMQFIFTFFWSFYVIIFNFIFVLFVSLKNYDIIMFVKNKFSKTIIFISKQKMITTKQWIITCNLLNRLILFNWNLFRIIALWNNLFKQFKIDLMFVVAYHSQIDENFEIINQIVEIVLRYWLIIFKQFNDWFVVLSCLQIVLNNSIKYNFIAFNLNQIFFDFRIHEIFDFVRINEFIEIKTLHNNNHITCVRFIVMN